MYTYYTAFSPGTFSQCTYPIFYAVDEAHTNVGAAQIVLANEL